MYVLMRKWPEMRKYLSSYTAEEEETQNAIYRIHDHEYGHVSILHAFVVRTPDDIIKAMIGIGGKGTVGAFYGLQ